MEKVGKFVIKYRIAIIVVVALLSVFFGWKALELDFNDDITKYPPQTDPLVSHYENLSEEFNIGSLIMIGMDINNADDLRIVDKITEELYSDENVQSVSSLSNVPIVNVSDYGMEVITLSDGIKDGTVDIPKVMENESIVGKFISDDGKSALITFSIKDGMDEKEIYTEIKDNLNDKYGVIFHYYGISPVNSAVETIAMRNLSKLIPIAVFIIFFILIISFKSFLGAFLPLLNVIVSVIWTMGIISLLNIPLTVANSVIPVVLISIGIAYSIHIINKYMEENGTSEEKIIKTEKEVGIAVILSGLTTAVGFLSLLTADINPVCILGIFSALGVLLANILALIFVPTVLKNVKKRREGIVESRLNIPEKLLNPYLVIIIFVGIVAVLIPLALNLKTDMDIINSINPDEIIIKDCEYIGDNFGGNGTIFIDVKGDFKSPELMQTIYAIEQELIKTEGVNKTYSIVDLMSKLSKSFCGFECVPSSSDEVKNLWFFMESNDAIYQLVNRDFTRGIIQVSYDVGSREENELIIKNIQEVLDKNPGSFDLVEVNEENKSEISEYYSEFLDVSESEYEKGLSKAINTSAGNLFLLNSEELKSVINQANDFGYYQLSEEEKAEIFKRMIEIQEYSYDNLIASFKGVNEYYEDLAYDIDSLLFVRLREWKAENFSNILGLENTNESVISLLPAAQENVYIPGNSYTVEMSQNGVDEILLHIQDMLFNDMYESMFMTIVLVFLLFLLEFKSLKIALLGIIPSILTVILNFEIMGLLGISLNTATISIAAIAIGAGIDYAIHFVNRFKIEFSKYNDSIKAVRKTLITTGKGVIFNALSVSFGFFALVFSDIGIIREFGILTGISMLVAAFTSLVFLAATFTFIKKPLKKSRLN